MRAPEQLLTERLRLRKVERSDAATIFDLYAQDPAVTKYLSWRPHETLADTEQFIEGCLRGVIEWAWQQPEIHRFWAVCDVENRGSWRVMEKAGMQREGILRGWIRHPNVSDCPRDCYVYSIIRDENL